MHIKSHVKTHIEIPEIEFLFQNNESDMLTIRKLGEHKYKVDVIKRSRDVGKLSSGQSYTNNFEYKSFWPLPRMQRVVVAKTI